MDLSFLIPSKMRRRVLAFFCQTPELKMHVREIARQLESAPQLIYRELVNLESWGFLFSEKQGNQRVFSVNRRFYLFKPIHQLFLLLEKEANRPCVIENTYTTQDMVRLAKNTKIPDPLLIQLKSRRTKARAYAETLLLEKK